MGPSGQSEVRAGWLLCLLLFFVGAGFGVQAAADEVLAKQDIGQPRHAEKTVSNANADSVEPGLTKVLTTKHPRRTDIPDAFLVIMLALIGVVVISRRGVTGKEGVSPPKKD